MSSEKIKKLDKNELYKLWSDPKFSGSFSGISTFKNELKRTKNIDVSTNQIADMLRNIPGYQAMVSRSNDTNKPKRSYAVEANKILGM